MIQNLLANQLTLSQSLCEWDVIHQKMKQKMTISQAKLYQKVKKSPNQSECRHRSMTQKEKYFFDKGIHHIQRLKEKLQKPSIPLKIEQKKLSKKIQSNRGINQLLYEKALNIVAYQLQSTKQSENSAQNNNKVFLKKNQIIQKQIRCYNRLVQRSRIKSGTTRKRSASTAAQNIIIQKKSNERKSFKQLKKENQKKLRMALGSSLSIQRIKLVSQNQSTDLSQQKQKMSQCEDRKQFKTQQLQIKSKIKQGKKSITALLNTIKSKINPNNYKAFPKQKLIL